MKYRADIDGLRAISVLAVMAFHLGLEHVPGGFVGVDVFFVISGFLITGLLRADLDAGTFSLGRFYERRIRRIAPALVVVLAATTLVAALALYPSPFREYGRSLLAATLSFSNFYFWLTSNYFAAPSSGYPLLHTWSLAVEEQFYLVFPLMLAWLYALGRRTVVVALAVLAAGSLLLSALLTLSDATAAFYLPQSRAWELGLGALLALDIAPAPRSSWTKTALGATGLALIGGSFLWINASTPFPGLAAVPPCLGAALMIHGNRGGYIARALSWKPLVFIGLISYSLYLWHWPVIVLTKTLLRVGALSHTQQALAALLSVLLATLSWRFVEKPLRRAPLPRITIFQGFAASAALLSVCAAFVVLSGGAPQRFSRDVDRLASFVDYPVHDSYRIGSCFIDSRYSVANFDTGLCLHATPGREHVVLMGDSHAAHLWQALAAALPRDDVLQATASGCIPTVTARPYSAARCTQLMRFMYGNYLPQHHEDTIVLSAEWSGDDKPYLLSTFSWARAHAMRVVLLGPSIEYDQPLPLLLADARRSGDANAPNRHLLQENTIIDREFAALAAAQHVPYVSVYNVLCPAGHCMQVAPDGAPMQFDRDHYTHEGAVFVAAQIEREGVLRQ